MGLQPKPPTTKGSGDWFTGDVWIDPILQPQGDSPLNIGAWRGFPLRARLAVSAVM